MTDISKLSNDIRDWQFSLSDKDLVVFEEYQNTLNHYSSLQEEEEEESKDIDDDMADVGLFGLMVKPKDIAIYNSPFGPVRIPELTDPTKHFKLWTMYSKVQLSPYLLSKIEKLNGVETLEVLTRYRARIGISPLFQDGMILNSIKEIIEQSVT